MAAVSVSPFGKARDWMGKKPKPGAGEAGWPCFPKIDILEQSGREDFDFERLRRPLIRFETVAGGPEQKKKKKKTFDGSRINPGFQGR